MRCALAETERGQTDADERLDRPPALTSLELWDFKSFADETLRLGPFTLIVGDNSSGKSNLVDALRILHGVGRGYDMSDILRGRRGDGGQMEWEPIRGAPGAIARDGHLRFQLAAKFAQPDGGALSYRILAEPGKPGEAVRIIEEVLHGVPKESAGDAGQDCENRLGKVVDLGPLVRPDMPSLTRKSHEDALAGQAARSLAGIHIHGPTAFDSDLAEALLSICSKTGGRGLLLQWVRELTALVVEDLEFSENPWSGRVEMRIKERCGRRTEGAHASAGVLRLLDILAAMMGAYGPGLHVFDNISDGVHPARQHLLAELIESHAADGDIQVLATTHSPELLAAVGEETFRNSSVTYRVMGAANSIVRPLAALPNAEKLRDAQGMGRLLAGGWMENILYFSKAGEVEECA